MKSKICWVLFCRYAKVLVQRNFVIILVIFNIPLLCYIYYKLNLLNYAWYNRSHRFTLHCRTPPEDMDALMDLSRDLHFVLKKLNITHWLAYGRYVILSTKDRASERLFFRKPRLNNKTSTEQDSRLHNYVPVVK